MIIESKEAKFLANIPKTITVERNNQVYKLSYIDDEICYYIDNKYDEGLYIATIEMEHHKISVIKEDDDLATNFLFIDTSEEKEVFIDICEKYKDNKPYLFMSDEMQIKIKNYLSKELEI